MCQPVLYLPDLLAIALLERHNYPVCQGKNGNGEFFKVYKFLKVNPIS